MNDNSDIFVPSHQPYNMPFFYNSISVLWVFYPADPDVLAGYLQGTGLRPAIFDGHGLVSIDFQNYTAHLGMLLSGVNEVEFSIHAYPESAVGVPTGISLDDYLIGQEATKTIGAFRLWVPADNCVAIDAGRWAFGERKFYTTFKYEVPSPNDPAAGTWNYAVYQPPAEPCFKPPDGLCEGDPCHPLFGPEFPPSTNPAPDQPFLYKTKADFRHLVPRVGNASPLRLYSMFPGGPDWMPGDPGQKLIQSFWNLLGTYATYCPLEGGVDLAFGTGDFVMRADMERILGNPPSDAVGARVFQSPPQAIQNRATFVNP